MWRLPAVFAAVLALGLTLQLRAEDDRGRFKRAKASARVKRSAAKNTLESRSGAACDAPVGLNRKSPRLQRTLVRALRGQGWAKHLERESLAVSVVDLTDPNRIYYAGVNDDHMMYAASLPKIAALLAVVEAVHRGRLRWSHEFDQRLQNMIVASSNSDASWATDLVGLLEIEKVMRDPRYCFYREPQGGLWLGRAYRPGGASNRDPLFNISHGASARQAARYYTMLHRGLLVTPHWSFRMLGLMAPPKHHHKFVGGLGERDGVVFMARKSGTWRTYHSDSALIKHFDNTYVLVGLSDTRHGETIMRELAKVVDDIIVEGRHRKNRRGVQAKR